MSKTKRRHCTLFREDDWKQLARTRLRKFEEELQTAFEAGMKSYSGNTAWNFINGVIYALTVVSTIGKMKCQKIYPSILAHF